MLTSLSYLAGVGKIQKNILKNKVRIVRLIQRNDKIRRHLWKWPIIWLVHPKWRRPSFCPILYSKEMKEFTYPFSGVSIALPDDCKGDVFIRVWVPQGLISEASWVHSIFISDMLLCVLAELMASLFQQLNFEVVSSSVFIVFSSFFGGRTKVR